MTESVVDYSEQPLAVEVDDVTMIFNMASESLTNLKEYFIKLAKHELFFEEFRALKHISFDIHRGEVVGLVGTNGSGKSTMLKIIAGVLEPSEGSVKVHGNIAPLIELGAGFDPELTARENIYLNGACSAIPRSSSTSTLTALSSSLSFRTLSTCRLRTSPRAWLRVLPLQSRRLPSPIF